MIGAASAAPPAKRQVTRIVFHRAEGLASECGTTIFEGPTAWEDCERHIFRARRTAPATGGYDKCDVTIEWGIDETGEAWSYETRYDMQHLDRSGWGDTLASHVRSSWEFYAFVRTPSHLTPERHLDEISKGRDEHVIIAYERLAATCAIGEA